MLSSEERWIVALIPEILTISVEESAEQRVALSQRLSQSPLPHRRVHVRLAISADVSFHWIPPHMRAVATIIGAIARYAFLTAIFIGAVSWAYGNRRRPPSIYVLQGYSRHLYRFCFLAGLATTALVVCIVSDLVLATIRLGSLSPSLAFSVPVASIAFEIACVAALVIFIRALVRLTLATGHLQPG
jgi:hypothetical protein